MSTARSACRNTRRSTARHCTKVDATLAPLPVYLGALGMPGMTAYFGLLDVGKPQAGRDRRRLRCCRRGRHGRRADREDQGLPRRRHRRRRGEVRLPARDLGFDAAIDYKSEDVKKALRQHCPKGINVYFDNVGGDILDAALTQLARNARIVICGAISQYNSDQRREGSGELHVAAGQSREHDRHGGVRLRRSLCGGDARDGGLDRRRQAQVARRHRRRARDVSGDAAQAVQGREHGKLVLKV